MSRRSSKAGSRRSRSEGSATASRPKRRARVPGTLANGTQGTAAPIAPERLGELDERLRSLDPDGRREALLDAATALREAAEGPVAEQLVTRLALLARDPSWEVRNALAQALGGLGQRDFDPVLGELVRDDHGYVRRSAEDALRRRSQRQRVERDQEQDVDSVLARIDRLAERTSPRVAAEVRALAQALANRVVSAAAHEIRSTLMALQQSLVRVERALGQPSDPWPAFRKTTERRIQTLDKIVSDMKELATIGDLVLEPTNLRRLVAEALEDVRDRFQGSAARAHVATELDVAPELTIQTSPSELRRALQNLLRNAFEAVEVEGLVRVVAERRGEQVLLRIQDNGCGIPGEDLRRVFLPGHSTKRGREQYPDKTGWGLPIAQRIVEAAGGEIRPLESEEGAGTTVTLVLPLAQGEDEP